jgi:hypothetical protein
MLCKFDLPDLCEAIAPRPVWLVNPVGSQGNGVPLSEIHESYGVASRAYANVNQSERLSFRIEPDPIDSLIFEWAQKSLLA